MLNPDYKDMLSFLLERRVDFLIVGAYAMAAHGYPRATGDIDIFVKPSRENAAKVYQAIGDFGAPLDGVSPVDFKTPGTIFQIGVAPRRIDIITEIDGVTFEEADADKKIIDIEGLNLPFVSKKKLIINKLSTGRKKDQLDAENMKRE
jgi:hypothetical protein